MTEASEVVQEQEGGGNDLPDPAAAGTSALVGAELRERNMFDTKMKQLEKALGQKDEQGRLTNPKLDRAKQALVALEQSMVRCEEHAHNRIGKIKDLGKRDADTDLWLDWQEKNQDKLDEYMEQYKRADPGYVSPNSAKAAALTNHVKMVNDKQNQIQGFLDGIDIDIEKEDGQRTQVLNKAKLALYNKRIEQVKVLIRPELSDLYNERAQYETNLTAQKKAEADYKNQLAAYDSQILATQTKLYSLDWQDNTFDTFQPDRASTRVSHASGGNSSSTGNHTRMATLKYKALDPPTFDGTKAKYITWKEEMQLDIIPAMQSEKASIRLLENYTPHKNLGTQFSSLDEIWVHLDKMYGDTVGSTEDMLTDFLAMKRVKGNNPQQQLVAVYDTVKTLQNQLTKNGYESQLSETFPTVAKCFSLLPPYYREHIVREIAMKEKSAGRTYQPKEKFKEFMDWLQGTHGYVTIHLREALTGEDQQSEHSGEEGDGFGGFGGARGGDWRERKKKNKRAFGARANIPEPDLSKIPPPRMAEKASKE